MSRFFGRVWAIEIGLNGSEGKRYEGLDLNFTVKQNDSSRATTCDLTIFSPDKEIIDRLGNKDSLVKIYAGWEDSGPVEIAQGSVVFGSLKDKRLSQDPQVSCQISKGRQISSSVSLSQSWSNVTSSEVIEYIRKKLGLVYDVVNLKKDIRYSRGYAVHGSPIQELGSIVRDCESQYTSVDGRLRIWPVGESAKVLVDVWASDTGLLEAEAQGSTTGRKISASILLRPSTRAGDVVKLECEQYNGQILIKEITHNCDTTSDAWYTTIVGVPFE